MRVKDDSAKVKNYTDGSLKVKDKYTDCKGKVDANGKMKEKTGDTIKQGNKTTVKVVE